MASSELRLIKHYVEYFNKDRIDHIPKNTRGIYVLFKHRPRLHKFDVVYVGMAGAEKAGIKGRLRRHRSRKNKYWTHFSVFEVWDNIREEEIRELEGLFRHIYQKDTQANRLNRQRKFKKLVKIKNKTKKDEWLNPNGRTTGI
jgi:hypothetical protein